MKALDGATREHEEFRLRLEKEQDVGARAISARSKDVAEAQAKVLGRGARQRRRSTSSAATASSSTASSRRSSSGQLDGRLLQNSERRRCRPLLGDYLDRRRRQPARDAGAGRASDGGRAREADASASPADRAPRGGRRSLRCQPAKDSGSTVATPARDGNDLEPRRGRGARGGSYEVIRARLLAQAKELAATADALNDAAQGAVRRRPSWPSSATSGPHRAQLRPARHRRGRRAPALRLQRLHRAEEGDGRRGRLLRCTSSRRPARASTSTASPTRAAAFLRTARFVQGLRGALQVLQGRAAPAAAARPRRGCSPSSRPAPPRGTSRSSAGRRCRTAASPTSTTAASATTSARRRTTSSGRRPRARTTSRASTRTSTSSTRCSSRRVGGDLTDQGREQHQGRPGHLPRAGRGRGPVARRRARSPTRSVGGADPAARSCRSARRRTATSSSTRARSAWCASTPSAQACSQLPEDQGIVFPGGYYLQTGDYKLFDGDSAGPRVRARASRSPNGEDVLYVFHRRDEGSYVLFPYNLIRKEVRTRSPGTATVLFATARWSCSAPLEEPTACTRCRSGRRRSSPPSTPRRADRRLLPRQGRQRGAGARHLRRALARAAASRTRQPTRARLRGPRRRPRPRASTRTTGSGTRRRGPRGVAWRRLRRTAELDHRRVREGPGAAEAGGGRASPRRRTPQGLLLDRCGREQLPSAWSVHAGADRAARAARPADHPARRSATSTWRGSTRSRRRRVDEFDRVSDACVEFLLGDEALAAAGEADSTRCWSAIEKTGTGHRAGAAAGEVEKAGGLEVLGEVVGGLQVDDPTRARRSSRASPRSFARSTACARLEGGARSSRAARSARSSAPQFKLLGQASRSALALCGHAGEVRRGAVAPAPSSSRSWRAASASSTSSSRSSRRSARSCSRPSAPEAGAAGRAPAPRAACCRRRTASSRASSGGRTFKTDDELNAYFASDAMVQKLRQDRRAAPGARRDSVQADELESRLKAARQDALRALRDRRTCSGGGEDLIKFGKHRFNVNTQPLELTLVPPATGWRSTSPARTSSSRSTTRRSRRRARWDQQLVSETPEVYRGEFLAHSMRRTRGGRGGWSQAVLRQGGAGIGAGGIQPAPIPAPPPPTAPPGRPSPPAPRPSRSRAPGTPRGTPRPTPTPAPDPNTDAPPRAPDPHRLEVVRAREVERQPLAVRDERELERLRLTRTGACRSARGPRRRSDRSSRSRRPRSASCREALSRDSSSSALTCPPSGRAAPQSCGASRPSGRTRTTRELVLGLERPARRLTPSRIRFAA